MRLCKYVASERLHLERAVRLGFAEAQPVLNQVLELRDAERATSSSLR
jgi:hypothetical protein